MSVKTSKMQHTSREGLLGDLITSTQAISNAKIGATRCFAVPLRPCDTALTASHPRPGFINSSKSDMAPNLAQAQHELIPRYDRCIRSVRTIRSNLRYFGQTKAPADGGGCPRSITPPMLEDLREHLIEKPDQYLYELVIFLYDEFEVQGSYADAARC